MSPVVCNNRGYINVSRLSPTDVIKAAETTTGLVGFVVLMQYAKSLRAGRRTSKRRCGAPKDYLTYARERPRKPPRPRKPVSHREAVAYAKLYELGYSINQVARAFGRSTSVVYRRLCQYIRWGLLKRRGYVPQDLRKLPTRTRLVRARRRWQDLLKYLPLWLAWIDGEGDEPP